MGKSILKEKSYDFAIEIVKMVQLIQNERKEYVLSKQIMRSGTAIGALIYEAEYGQSRADFVHKLTISLKEANETHYWLSLLYDTQYLEYEKYLVLSANCTELIKMLVASINTARSNSS